MEKYTVVRIYKRNLCDKYVFNGVSGECLTKCNDIQMKESYKMTIESFKINPEVNSAQEFIEIA